MECEIIRMKYHLANNNNNTNNNQHQKINIKIYNFVLNDFISND